MLIMNFDSIRYTIIEPTTYREYGYNQSFINLFIHTLSEIGFVSGHINVGIPTLICPETNPISLNV